MGTLTCHPDPIGEVVHALQEPSYIGPVDEKAMPLTVLAERLIIGPPSIRTLIDLLEQSEYVQAFLELVREYLPEHEREIMLKDHYDRATAFCHLFSERYFPLDEDWLDMDEALETLTYQIPVRLGGMTYDDYHEFSNFRDEHNLLLSLACYPYVVHDEEGRGARVALLEEVARIVGKGITEKIPPEGWEPEYLHKVLDGTRFEGVADFADWVCSCTGCWLLDADYENYAGEPWERETVDELTAQWPKVGKITDNINHMMDWLEDNRQANFVELLGFILERQGNQVPKEQLPLPLEEPKPKTLMEVFSNERLSQEVTDDDILEANSF